MCWNGLSLYNVLKKNHLRYEVHLTNESIEKSQNPCLGRLFSHTFSHQPSKSRFPPKEFLMVLSGCLIFWFVEYIISIRSVDVEIIGMNPYKAFEICESSFMEAVFVAKHRGSEHVWWRSRRPGYCVHSSSAAGLVFSTGYEDTFSMAKITGKSSGV